MQIAILDDYQNVAEQMADWASLGCRCVFFHEHCGDVARLAQDLAEFDCIVLMRERTAFPRALLEKLPRLCLLVTAGKKNTSLDLEAATQLGIQVCGTDTLARPTVELTWGLILSLARNIPGEVEALRQGRWQTSLGSDLNSKTLGLIGLGRLGSAVAQVGVAFGMRIIAWSPSLTQTRAAEFGASRADKQELLSQSDFVSLHLTYNAQTKGLIGADELALMKESAFLINTSRAGIIDEAALLQALHACRIAGAGLDVLPQEPLPPNHPLLACRNVIVTPHLGYVTASNFRLIYGQVVEAISAYLVGAAPLRALNHPD